MRWWGVVGAAEGLTQAVGPRLAEYEPVSNVELRQQTVLHDLVHVIPGGPPQAAAEQCSIPARALQAEERRRLQKGTQPEPAHVGALKLYKT